MVASNFRLTRRSSPSSTVVAAWSNLFSAEAERLRLELKELLQDEVERAFAEQEAFAAER